MANAPVLVVGAGSWGTALALVLARNGRRVRLWDSDRDHIRRIRAEGRNRRYLPQAQFPPGVEIIETVDAAGELPEGIVIAAPCQALREVLALLRQFGLQDRRLCLACKGLQPGALLLNHQVVEEMLGAVSMAVLSGPSFAAEVATGLPTAVTVAARDPMVADLWRNCFHQETFRVYTHDDIVGVQVGGAVKNVMAIAAGIADGLGYGANTRAALITRGLAEIIRLGVALGGKKDTFMGLTGLGDLVLTCTDDQSRNRRLGLAIAHGQSVAAARQAIGQTVEGIDTAAATLALAGRHKVEMPITEQVVGVLSGRTSPAAAVQNLLAREPKPERW
jgi:glycerol-3-phosphate dehydrogenase (NAD(P)+)